MPTPAPFDGTRFRLARHGDSRERQWAPVLLRDFPHYETFWQRHIVPLSFRVVEEGNYFLRPTQVKPLIHLADTCYATFLHLVQAHEWAEELGAAGPRLRLRATECLYCFFSHAYSMIDACLAFCRAVNEVCGRYKAETAFYLRISREGALRGLDAGASRDCIESFNALRTRLGLYRNFLVHRQPVFLQNAYMPRPEHIEELSGLTSVSRLARDPTQISRCYEKVDDATAALLKEMRRVLDTVWTRAQAALDAIESPRYREHQLRVRPEDQGITLEKIRGVRKL
ncbi:MAG: hypothetical protein R6X25_01135 [Candidatus Krumholzibacteriia bacterium]